MKTAASQPQSLWNFGSIWLGQFGSLIGSQMSIFALTIWLWEQTGTATSVSLLFLFSQAPTAIAALFMGVLVDHCNRKYLMLVGNAIAGCSSIVIVVLVLSNRLTLWQILLAVAINGFFSYLQGLALSASTPLLLPKKHYGRAGALTSLKGAGALVIAPALAGVLYPKFGLLGILGIDLTTFGLACISLIFVRIPQPADLRLPQASEIHQALTFGFRYIAKQPGLRAILTFLACFNFFWSGTFSILPATILARSGNDVGVLAVLQSAFGLGGLCGALALSITGGIKPRINGFFLGAVLPCVGLIALVSTQGTVLWVSIAFLAAASAPLLATSNQAIWLAKVNPRIQGRVFASRYLLAQVSTPLGAAIAGPLADRLFEPAMNPGGSLAPILGPWIGTGAGVGLSLQLGLFALCGIAIGLGGFCFRQLREAEASIPDYAEDTAGN